MAEYAGTRRSLAEWLKHDLSGVIGPRRLARLLRREPMLLVWMLINVGIVLAVVTAILFAVGRFDLFGYGVLGAALVGGGLTSRRMERALAKYPALQR